MKIYSVKKKIQQPYTKDFPGGPVVKTSPSNAENAFLIPGQGTRSHVPQGHKTKTKIFGGNIVTNAMKTLKMVHLKKCNCTRIFIATVP